MEIEDQISKSERIEICLLLSDQPFCKICLGEDSPFLSPCLCAGSLGKVHAKCMTRWRRTFSEDSPRFNVCPDCKGTYDIPVSDDESANSEQQGPREYFTTVERLFMVGCICITNGVYVYVDLTFSTTDSLLVPIGIFTYITNSVGFVMARPVIQSNLPTPYEKTIGLVFGLCGLWLYLTVSIQLNVTVYISMVFFMIYCFSLGERHNNSRRRRRRRYRNFV